MKVPQTAGRKFSVRGMVQSKTIRKRARLRLSLKRGFRARLSSPVAARDNSVRDCTALEARSSSVKAQQPVSNPVSFQSPIRAKEAPDASQSIVGAALAEAEKTPFEFGKSEMKKETAPVLSSAAPLASGLTLPIGIPSYGSTSTPVFSASGFSVGSGGTVVSASSSQRRKGRRKR
ncbi:hypothetical protein HOP50_02g17720 [Chloropicon primus]|uniref:Uncharacterized protein n=1 Tax=Chloropicon primus TaxID=1764295 RepID=A0A5B8MFU7_9CHLO|nr:hypothetical protein A3770_02p17750 [Chloropicon primus]UPQ98466.1 hypothetical protein HOP50_02g17720 [Chloropicon primus]|eukprot:QDZ19257.1 hypothetical protein A3770_02p17750 [Chloropicon primus]